MDAYGTYYTRHFWTWLQGAMNSAKTTRKPLNQFPFKHYQASGYLEPLSTAADIDSSIDPKNLWQMCQSHPQSRSWNRLEFNSSLGISIQLAVARRSRFWSSSFKMSKRPRIFKRTLPLRRRFFLYSSTIIKIYHISSPRIMGSENSSYITDSLRFTAFIVSACPRVVPLAVVQHHLHRAVQVFCPNNSWHIDWPLSPARTAPCWDSRCKHKMPRG